MTDDDDDNYRFGLLSEKTTVERMIAETPDADVLDLASLRHRLEVIERRLARLAEGTSHEWASPVERLEMPAEAIERMAELSESEPTANARLGRAAARWSRIKE